MRDLGTLPGVAKFLRWKYNRVTVQVFLFLLALLVLYDGFFGPQIASRNLAGSLPWIHWRGFLVLGILVVGNVFCMACPFMLPRKLAKKLLPAAWRFPTTSKWLAIALLVAFFWAYEAFDLWASPLLTAWVVLAYFLLAFIVDGFFRGAAFCKYVCPIGQFNFVNSLASPFEVRIRRESVCASCSTLDCIKGRQVDGRTVQSGCELYLFQPKKSGNADCTFCLDCVKACPHDNVSIITRPLLSDTFADKFRSGVGRLSKRLDYAALALVIVFGAYLNAFGMIPPVYDLLQAIGTMIGSTSATLVFTLLFVTSIAVVPVLVTGAAALVTIWLTQTSRPIAEVASCYAFALVPLGFGMWLSHYLFHFLTGALTVLSTLAQFFADFGVSFAAKYTSLNAAAIIPEFLVQPIIFGCQMLGFAGTLYAIILLSKQFSAARFRSSIPWFAVALLLFLLGVWIMLQPMEMRGVVIV